MADFLKGLREARAYYSRDAVIKRQVKRERGVVYGGQALVAQLGGLARNTRDWDIKSRNALRSGGNAIVVPIKKKVAGKRYNYGVYTSR
jgi:hypothetical protein